MQSLGAAIIRLTSEVSEMRGELKGFVNDKAHALQRVEIREETQTMIAREVALALKVEAGERNTADRETLSTANGYTDTKVKEMEARLVAQEERDKKREGDFHRQQIAMGGLVLIVVVYTIIRVVEGLV